MSAAPDPASLIDLARYPILDPERRDDARGPRLGARPAARDRRLRGARLPHRQRPGDGARRRAAPGADGASQRGIRHRLSRGTGLRPRRGPPAALDRTRRRRRRRLRHVPGRLAAAPPLRVGSVHALHRGGARARRALPLRRSARRPQPGGDGRRRRAAVALRHDRFRRLAGAAGRRRGRRFRGRAARPQRRRRTLSTPSAASCAASATPSSACR